LPVVIVKVANHDMRFLVDTAATTMLNLNSFSSGTSKKVHITSWTGTAATSAREVTLSDPHSVRRGQQLVRDRRRRQRHLELPAEL